MAAGKPPSVPRVVVQSRSLVLVVVIGLVSRLVRLAERLPDRRVRPVETDTRDGEAKAGPLERALAFRH